MGLSIRDNRHWVAAFAAGLLAILCLALPGPSAAGGGSDPTLTLNVTDDSLAQGGATRLRGKLTGATAGDAGRLLTVYRDPYPYGAEQVETTTTTDADGSYSLRVWPELNSSYRVELSDPGVGATSPSRNVYVYEQVKVKLVDRPGRLKIRAIYTLGYSPQVEPEYHPGRKTFFYFRKRSQKRFKRVGSAKWKDVSSGVRSAKAIDLPRSRKGYRYVIRGCTRYPDSDIGIGEPVKSGCPKRIKARSARARALSSPLRVGLESGS